MCGIGLCLSPEFDLKYRFSDKIIRLLRHRGPDGSGGWSDPFITLAHTRLAILDLSAAGHQPMISQSGRFVITFNGEIYNHLILRSRFLKDVAFKGHSDTETILALYEKLGSSMLQHLVGMWAMAIWDRAEKTLFVSRDRYGQKPLYWMKTGEALFFCSEINPLLNFNSSISWNELALSEYLGLGNYGHLFEQTFYQGISQILPAHFYVFSENRTLLKKESYWEIEEVNYNDRLPFDQKRCNEFKELVFEAVESQLLSDVEVGATLSGGLDSSIIVSCIAALGKKNFPVFTAQFPGTKYDETPYVKSLGSKWGNALEIVYTPTEKLSLKDSLEQVLCQQEEPFGDPSIMAHGFLVKAAKTHHVPVLLGGQGGDEVSLGYSWMFRRVFAYALHSGDLRSFASFVRADNTTLNDALRLMVAGMAPGLEHRLRMKARKQQKSNLAETLFLDSPGDAFGKVNGFNGIYLESLKTVGLPHLCQYDDRSTMACSIEGRMPFLDHRLIGFVSKLQPSAFYENGFSKSIFRKAFHDLLPREIRLRKDKIGFHTPIIDLITKDKQWVNSVINNSLTLQWIKASYLQTLINKLHQEQLDVHHATSTFRVLCANLWYQNFIVQKNRKWVGA